MTTEEKNEVNKEIRSYKGDNSFVISLQKQLKSNKYLKKEELGKRMIKVLSDRQYEAAKGLLN